MQAIPLFDDKPKAPPGAIEIELPWPPSANHYKAQTVMLPSAADMERAFFEQFKDNWKGLWKWIRARTRATNFLTDDAKEYHMKVQSCVIRANARKYFTSRLRMTIWVYPPDRRRRDTTNLYKMLEDAMQSAKVFEDDSQIKEHHAFFTDEVVEFGKVVVRIEEL